MNLEPVLQGSRNKVPRHPSAYDAELHHPLIARNAASDLPAYLPHSPHLLRSSYLNLLSLDYSHCEIFYFIPSEPGSLEALSNIFIATGVIDHLAAEYVTKHYKAVA